MIKTERLYLSLLNMSDQEFILELVNMPEWIRYIGDRNVHSLSDAQLYIQNARNDAGSDYWTVKRHGEEDPIGMITFMKRDYLPHHDVGYAFLSAYTNQGYALEATRAVMDYIFHGQTIDKILAISLPDNEKSIRLLKRMGLKIEKEIEVKKQLLSVYSISADQYKIDQLTTRFFNLFTNTNQQVPPLKEIYSICLPEANIIKFSSGQTEIFDLNAFLKPRELLLTNGTLTGFSEWEISDETRISHHIAQRISRYAKSGCLNGNDFTGSGTKLFQFAKAGPDWKIANVIWEDDHV